MASPTVVALEIGAKRVFAVALDWPGWARSGRSEEEALSRLAEYAGRYARTVDEPALADASDFEIVERLQGNATTDFGAPGIAPAADDRPLDEAELARQRRLLEAAWKAFDVAARAATGKQLTTGPRGGGRDVAKMVEHVQGAEEGYLAKLGSRSPKPAAADSVKHAAQLREAALEALTTRSRGEEPPDPNKVRERWSLRYYVRRTAWHALDHAWEIEDRVI